MFLQLSQVVFLQLSQVVFLQLSQVVFLQLSQVVPTQVSQVMPSIDPASHAQDELLSAYQQAQDALLQLSRVDVNEFVSSVIRDEDTNEPVVQALTHRRMHSACSRYRRLILWSHVEAGKTVQIAVARTLFILGKDPSARVAIISDTHEQSAKIVRMIAKIIEHSGEYKSIFPTVVKGEPWTSHHLYLRQADGRMMRDASVVAVGVGGNISGARITHMIWDDILDVENTSSQAQRDKTYNWLRSAECMGRLLKRAPLWVIGNAYHPDDALHRFAREPNWHFMRLPVIDDRGRPTWPERWDLGRIEDKRLDVGPLEFARQMLCKARDDSESRFQRTDLDACCARGRGLPWLTQVSDVLGTPWPLPAGAITSMPALPGGKVSHGVVGFDLDSPTGAPAEAGVPTQGPRVEALPVADTDSARDLAARGSSQAFPDGEPARLSLWGASAVSASHKGGGDPGPGERALADDIATVFPDTALHAARPESLRPGEDKGASENDVPAWLKDRQQREVRYAKPDARRAPRGRVRRLEVAPRSPRPVLAETDNVQNFLGDGPGTERPTAASETVEAASVTVEAASPTVDAPTPASETANAQQPTGQPASATATGPTPGRPASEAPPTNVPASEPATGPTAPPATGLPTTQLGKLIAAQRSRVSAQLPTHSPSLSTATPRTPAELIAAREAQVPDKLMATDEELALVGGPPAVSPESTPPSNSAQDFSADNLVSQTPPLGCVSEGAEHNIHVPGSPEGLSFAPDSIPWLELWLADPGTPHKNEDGWPIHPRSISGLKRLGVTFETGVDLAVQKHSAADFTVLYTIMVYPPMGPHGHRVRRLVSIERGKWYAMDICDRIVSHHERFGSIVTVENNQAQDYIRQMILDRHPNAYTWLRGFTTGRQKANPEFGVEQLAAEFHREQWVYPVPASWHPDREDVDEVIGEKLMHNFNEILYFDPREHTGDVLMAQWFAKEGARFNEQVAVGEHPVNVRTF